MEAINTNINYTMDMDEYFLFGNTTFNDSVEDLLYETEDLHYKNWYTPFIVIYCIVLFFAIFENAVTCICFFIKRKHLLGPTNIFIIGLAMSDIFFCAFFLPLQFYILVVGSWTLGKTMCTIFWLFDVPFSMSSMLILAIAIHRYWLTVHPLRRHLSNAAAACLVVVIAIICIGTEIPRILHVELFITSFTKIGYCIETWSNRDLHSLYNVSMKVVFQLPLVVSVLLHANIDQVLNHSTLERTEKQQKKKTNYILMVIAIIVFVCRLPWNLFWIILEFDGSIPFKGNPLITICILIILGIVSACINPFLYAWLNNNFGMCLARNSSEGNGSRQPPILG